MPELKLFKDVRFAKAKVDISAIRFKDKSREKQRKAAVARRALQPPREEPVQRGKPAANEAWSGQKDRRDRRDERKEKKARKRAATEAAGSPDAAADQEDMEDLDDDYRALKREKRLKKAGGRAAASEEDPEDESEYNQV